MKTKVIVIIAAVAVLALLGVFVLPGLFQGRSGAMHEHEHAGAVLEYYTCPMHPTVRSDRPGACPVCGMALVKKTVSPDTEAVIQHDIGEVAVSPSQQVLANVSTSVAEHKRLTKEIRAVGIFSAAEPNTRRISARFPGRLEHLYLRYVGQFVRRGDPVADMYSPEAISAQEEFLLALGAGEAATAVEGRFGLLPQSKEKLIRWGFSDAQIDELRRSRKVQDVVTLYSPISGTVTKKEVDPQQYAVAGQDLYEVSNLSTLWLNADVYEYEIPSLKIGLPVDASTDAYPGKVFRGSITFVSPSVDPSSRTVRVRAEFANRTGELKTEMYANAVIRIQLPETVVVPATAVLSTGQRRVVWVQKAEGIFEPRTVVVGETTPEFAQILDGLQGGETVVTSGGYLLDSESQLENPSAGKHEHTMEPQHRH